MPDNTIQVAVTATAEQAKKEFAATSAAAGDMASSIQGLASPLANINSQLAAQTEVLQAVRASLEEMAAAATHAKQAEREAEEETVSFRERLREMGTEAKETAEKVLELASAARLGQGASASLAGGIGAVGAAFGGGIIVHELTEMLNRVKENAIEMDHLALATGMAIPQLVGLTQSMVEQGASAGNINMIVSKLSSSMQAARDPSSKQAEAFRELGINTANWAHELPPLISVLEAMATHLHGSTQALQDNANMREVAGRNTVQLTAFLKESGEQLGANVAAHDAYGQSVAHAAEAALELQRIEAKMAEQWNTLASDNLPFVINSLKYLTDAWIVLKFEIGTAASYGTAAFMSMAEVASGFNDVLAGIVTGNLERLKNGFKELHPTDVIIDQFRAAAADTAKSYTEAWKQIDDLWKKPMHIGREEGDTNTEFQNKRFAKAQQQAREEEITAEENHNLEVLALERSLTEELLKLRVIGLEEATSALIRSTQDELAIRQDAIQKKIAIYAKDPDETAKVAKLEGEKTAAMDKAAKDQQAILQKGTEDFARYNEELRKLYDAMNTERSKATKHLQDEMDKEFFSRTEAAFKIFEAHEKANTELEVAELEHNMRVLEMDRDLALNRAKLAGAGVQTQLDLLNKYDSQISALQEKITAAKAAGIFTGPVNPNAELDRAKVTSQGQQAADRLASEHGRKVQEITSQTEQSFNKMFGQMNAQFSSAMHNWVSGTQSFGQAFRQMNANMVSTWINSLAVMGLKWVEHHLLLKAVELGWHELQSILHIRSNEQKVAADTAGAAATAPIRLSEILGAAAVGAANAMAATAVIPFVGPELAPAAGTAMFSSIMAWAPVAAFEGGGLTGSSEMMALLHPREMVLPRNLSEGIQGMIQNGGGSGGGDMHVHYHAFKGETPDSIARNKGEILKIVKEGIRSGRLVYQS